MELTETTKAYAHIMEYIVPEAIQRFESKTLDYRGGPAFQFLGAKGQFSDINRKFWKLYAALWEEKALLDESVEEVCFDLIGHLFLTIYCVREAEKK